MFWKFLISCKQYETIHVSVFCVTNFYIHGAFAGGEYNVHDVICGKNTFQLMWNTNGIIVTVFSDSFLIKFQ